MTTSTLLAPAESLDLTMTDDEINALWEETEVDIDDDEFYQECLAAAAEYRDLIERDIPFLQLCYWRLSYYDVEKVVLDDSHIISRGEETLVSVYDTLDGFYLALTTQDGSQEVKSFPYEITALEAATLVAHYGGCPMDKENYLEAVKYDLGLSYTPEYWDAEE